MCVNVLVLAVFVQLVEQLLVSKGHKKFTHTATLAESESSRTARKYKERPLTVIN